jgi:hypothetical protein
MAVVLLAAAALVSAFAIPYHAPRAGLCAGVAGLALSAVMMLRSPVSAMTGRARGPALVDLDFNMTRPIGIALGLYALLWLVIAAVQLARPHVRVEA